MRISKEKEKGPVLEVYMKLDEEEKEKTKKLADDQKTLTTLTAITKTYNERKEKN